MTEVLDARGASPCQDFHSFQQEAKQAGGAGVSPVTLDRAAGARHSAASGIEPSPLTQAGTPVPLSNFKFFPHALEQRLGEANALFLVVLFAFVFAADVAAVAGVEHDLHHARVVGVDFIALFIELM